MTIRALCTDIDGTLLNRDRQLSAKTIDVVKKVSKKVPIILASSRMPSAMTHLQQELAIVGLPLIAYNGGYVIRYESESKLPVVYDSVFIPVDICEDIVNRSVGTQINVSLYFEDEWFAPQMDQWTEREERITKVKATIEDPNKVITRWRKNNAGAHKVMCMGPENEMNILEKDLRHLYSSNIHIYRSRPTYIEIASSSISKASALELILNEQYNLSVKDAIAFGDNYNDIDMLQSVGLGIAVENAKEEVRAVAKEITAKSIDDGVALAIEKYQHYFG